MKISGRLLALILVPLSLLAVLLYGREARDRLRASAAASQVERLTLQLQGSGRLQRGDANVARTLRAGLEVLRRAAEDDPGEVAVPIAQAALYRLLGSPKAAVRAYEEGLGIESRPEIYAQLGHTLWAMGEEDAARDAFRKAVALNHNLARDLRIYLPELEEQWRHRQRRQRRDIDSDDTVPEESEKALPRRPEGDSDGSGRDLEDHGLDDHGLDDRGLDDHGLDDRSREEP